MRTGRERYPVAALNQMPAQSQVGIDVAVCSKGGKDYMHTKNRPEDVTIVMDQAHFSDFIVGAKPCSGPIQFR